MKKKLEKILVVRLSSLGDIILTTPIIRSLRKKYPSSIIDFLLKDNYSEVLSSNPYINNLKLYSSAKSLNVNEYDLIIDLQNNFRSNQIRRGFSGRIIKFRKPSLRKFLLVNFKLNLFNEIKSIPQLYSESIENCILDSKGADFFLNNDFTSDPVENFVVFCPGAKHFTKRWPEEYFIKLAKMFEEKGIKVALVGGKDDEEIIERISENISNLQLKFSEDKLNEIVKIFKRARIIITNDSGMMHLACTQNVKVVTIFGSTVKEFGFFPYNCNSILIENKEVKCRPCSHIGKDKCPKGHFNCMKSIYPEIVFNKALSMENVNE